MEDYALNWKFRSAAKAGNVIFSLSDMSLKVFIRGNWIFLFHCRRTEIHCFLPAEAFFIEAKSFIRVYMGTHVFFSTKFMYRLNFNGAKAGISTIRH